MSTLSKMTVRLSGTDTYELAAGLRTIADSLEEGMINGSLIEWPSIIESHWDVIDHELCEECGGIDNEHNDIIVDDIVDPSEPHLHAPVGTAKCPNAK